MGLNAFEDKTNGLLVQHLHPLLRKPIGIDAVMSELREGLYWTILLSFKNYRPEKSDQAKLIFC